VKKKKKQPMTAWPPEERAAYDAAFAEARDGSESTRDSVEALKKSVLQTAGVELPEADNLPPGNKWARWVLEAAIDEGLRQIFDKWVQRDTEKFLCDLHGGVASKPKVGGTKRRTSSGQTAHQQVLYEVMTLGQINQAIAEASRSRYGLDVKLSHMELYAAICRKANDALGILPEHPDWEQMTPVKAAEILEVTIENWLLEGGNGATG
jgi:hypothetical protein